ncbi:hypothetical protein [Stutzerimonas azotifigens]|uniref:hypothetical protein n=1 Tax=Stutzerimonas azotifigens TaxID=291995 RepID=UPI0004026700|nr:hypothetical protein [Stutzerimonas azotifigens]
MSLQAQFGLMDPSQLLNTLAMLLAIAGSWLLLATRWREWLAAARVPAGQQAPGGPEAAATARLNQMFYCVGYAGLALALMVSWGSRLI